MNKFVVNRTGATIPNGKAVRLVGYDAIADAFTIELVIADSLDNVGGVLGITTTDLIDDAVGLVTLTGRVNNIDTTSLTEGAIVYVSDTVAGDLTTTAPAIAVSIARAGLNSATLGFVSVTPILINSSIYAGISSSADQTFGATGTPQSITFNTHDQILGVSHDTVTNNDEITIDSSGVYQFSLEPQLDRTSGSSNETLDVWAEKDTGGGFVAIPNTNIKKSAGGSGDTGISPLTIMESFNIGDKIRFRMQTTSTSILLNATPASGAVPATPSAILTLSRIGESI